MTTATVAAGPALPRAGPVALDHLSWSGIQLYRQCGKRWFLKYIAKVPPEFIPAPLAFGGAFHSAIELVQQRLIEGSALPAIEDLMKEYEQAWKKRIAEAPFVAYSKTASEASLRQLAEKMLSAYRDYIAVQSLTAQSQIIGIEHAQKFRLLANVPPIEMRLDLLELQGPDLIVTDIKTSASKFNESKIREGLPQLVLYSYGLMPLLHELGAKRIVPRFLVITKNKTPSVQMLEPEATQADVERLKALVSDTWDAIQKEVFVPREGWQCGQCPFRRRCLGK